MAKVLLIDGPAIAYRSHFALAKANLTSSSGENTAATYGYTNTLLKLLREESPEFACVAFDTEEPTYRHQLFEEYKAGRPDMPDDLVNQLDWIRDITEALGLTVLEAPGFEADDIIATLAHKATEAGLQVTIATGDKDMLQLVNANTRVIMLSGWGRDTKVLDEKAVVAKYEIGPGLLTDYFGLMGDAVDNVPGVPGIGEKTARALVKQYGNLESIFESLETITSKRVRTALTQHRDAAFSSRELVSTNRNVPLPVDLEGVRRRPIREDRIREFFMKLGFRTLLRQICGDRRSVPVTPKIWHAGAVPDGPDLTCEGRMGIVVNTDGTGASSNVLGVAVCCEGRAAYYFPISHREPGNMEPDAFVGAVGETLEAQVPAKVVHDAKQVVLSAKRLGVGIGGIVFDTLLGGYLLNPDQSRITVESLAADYLGRFLDAGQPDRPGKLLVTLKQASERCCERAHTILEASKVMEEELKEKGLWRLFDEIELPLSYVLADMELRGIKVDRGHLERLANELDKKLSMIEKDAYRQAGRQFNLNSPRDISHLLFDEIGLKPRRRTKTGYSTDLAVLTELGAEHELPRTILEHRQISKLKSAYVDQLLRFADPESDRIHTSFHQAVAATGRLSSSDPNLQSIPIRTDLGAEIRKAFIPSTPDWILISADYSQIELRILAHLSEDEALREAFERGEDIHSKTASFIFRTQPQAVTQHMRTIAKTVNFGIVYGMGPQSLAKATGLGPQEASGFLDEHKRGYPGLYSYIEQSLQDARGRGYVETILGRKRFLPNIASSDPAARSAAERMAVNTPIQGSAADIIKIAMLRVYEEMVARDLEGGIVLQVHDEIVIDCPQKELTEAEEILRRKMGEAYNLSVPLVVEVRNGNNWYEAH